MPADYGPAVWEAVHAAGEPHGITAYGTETMHVLRAEKGYIIVGQETDGTVIPADLGLDWTIGTTKRDFVGKRSLTRPDMLRADRRQLVGLLAPEVLEEGAQLVADATAPLPMLGHVTSAYWSETLQRPIALALLSGGRARIGQMLYVPMADRTIAVRVTDPVSSTTGRAGACMADRAHPLAASAAGSPDCPAVQLAALPPATRLIIRGDASVLAIDGTGGARTPVAPQRSAIASLLWLGPDEFLLLASDGCRPRCSPSSRRRVASRSPH